MKEPGEEAVLQENTANVLSSPTLEKRWDLLLQEGKSLLVDINLEVELALEFFLKLQLSVNFLLVLLLLLSIGLGGPSETHIWWAVLQLLDLLADALDLVFVLLLADH